MHSDFVGAVVTSRDVLSYGAHWNGIMTSYHDCTVFMAQGLEGTCRSSFRNSPICDKLWCYQGSPVPPQQPKRRHQGWRRFVTGNIKLTSQLLNTCAKADVISTLTYLESTCVFVLPLTTNKRAPIKKMLGDSVLQEVETNPTHAHRLLLVELEDRHVVRGALTAQNSSAVSATNRTSKLGQPSLEHVPISPKSAPCTNSDDGLSVNQSRRQFPTYSSRPMIFAQSMHLYGET